MVSESEPNSNPKDSEKDHETSTTNESKLNQVEDNNENSGQVTPNCEKVEEPKKSENGSTGGVQQDINNKSRVEKQTNVVHADKVEEHNYNNYFGYKGTSKESTFKDPTQSLPNNPTGLHFFDSISEINKHFNELKTNRIILVDSFYEDILRTVSYELVNQSEEKYEKRLLTFEGSQLEQTDLHLGVFVNEQIGNGESLIVVVSLKSQRFLDSMFFEERLHAQSITEQLAKKDIMLICFADTEFLQETLETKIAQFHFRRWNIPFLPYLLTAYFDNTIAQSLEEQILQQRNYGLWDENNSDREFYELISGYLRNGSRQLQEEVDKRKKYKKGQNVQNFFTEIRTVIPKELVNNNDIIKNTVLYVGIFFPVLSRHDFNYLVSLLLEGKKTTVIVKSQITTKKGKIKTIEIPEEKECLEIWKNDQDQILEECHLQVMRSETDSLIIDFSLPYLRVELKRYLEQKNLYIQHFELIRESGLLFNFNVSSNIIENVINLAAEMAISAPSHYGSNWLMGLISGIKQHLAIEVDFNPNNEFEALMGLLAIELEKEEKQQQVKPFIIRLSELIREMLNHHQLQEMIKNFLDNMMKEKHYDAVLILVLGIVKQLRFASQFDGMYWIRQLLERGAPEAKNEAYKTLLEQAKQSGLRIYELLDNLKTWIPDCHLDHEKYSSSNKYALKFIIDYTRETLSNFKIEYYGVWPSKYPLFANIREEQEFTQIDSLIAWVFHPGMQYALAVLGDSIHNNVNLLLSDLIEIWFKILYGLNSGNICSEVLTVSERLLLQVVLNTNRSQQTELMRRWWARQNFFMNEIKSLDVAQRTQRKSLADERKVVLELHGKFKQLLKS